MTPDWISLLLLTLWGGWVAIDGTSVGQFMISRPLVAASVAGWIVGDPAAGALLGLLLEALHLTVLPVGAAHYPEGGPAAVAAGAAFAATEHTLGALLTAVLFALAWERVAGASVRQLRQLNTAVAVSAAAVPLPPDAIERRLLAAVALDFLRGALLAVVGMLLLGALLAVLLPLWQLPERIPRITLAAALAAAFAASFRVFAGGGRARLVIIGALCGLLFLGLR